MKLNEFTYFYAERPILAVANQPLIQKLSESDSWIAQLKYNGQNCAIHIMKGVKDRKIEFWSRHGAKLKYQPIHSKDENLHYYLDSLDLPLGYTVIHAELRHNKVTGIREKITLHDVWVWDGKLLSKEPYWARLARLQDINRNFDLLKEEPKVTIIKNHETDFQTLYQENYGQGEIEGLVIKNKKGKLNLSRKACQKSSWQYKIRFADFNYKDSRAGCNQLTGAL